MYIHELKDWPKFHWSAEAIAAPLASVRDRQGRLIRHMDALGFNLQQEAVLNTLTADVLKSSEIEGEKLDAGQVRSSIARRYCLWTCSTRTTNSNTMVAIRIATPRTLNQPVS